jgi:hypothetical protein
MVLWEKTEISCLHKKWHKLEERLDCATFLCRFCATFFGNIYEKKERKTLESAVFLPWLPFLTHGR